VADMVGLQLAVGQVPHLDVLVPARGDDDRVLVVGREPDAGDPVLVAVLLDGVLALGQGVPQLDGLVPRGGHDLPVVGGEGHGQHVLGVVLEPARGLAGGQVPQAQGLVPGAGEGEVPVRAEHHVGDKVGVAVEALLGYAVVAHVIPGELPDDEGLVPGGTQDHVRVLGVGGQLGDPSPVAPEGAAELQSLRHRTSLKEG